MASATSTPSISTLPAPEQVLGDLLCFDLYSLSRTMTRLYRPILEPHGLTYPQFLVLCVLARLGPSPISVIARATDLDHGTLTPIMRRLEARALLTRRRDETDGRSVTMALAPAGEVLRPLMYDAQCRIVAALGMSEEDLARLQRTLQRLSVRLVAASGVE